MLYEQHNLGFLQGNQPFWPGETQRQLQAKYGDHNGAWNAITLTPVALISVAAALPLSAVRQVIMTRAPAAASALAVSIPIPVLPPGSIISIVAHDQTHSPDESLAPLFDWCDAASSGAAEGAVYCIGDVATMRISLAQEVRRRSPVTTAVFPFKSMPSSTSEAVLLAPYLPFPGAIGVRERTTCWRTVCAVVVICARAVTAIYACAAERYCQLN